jgi:hypothetical protein
MSEERKKVHTDLYSTSIVTGKNTREGKAPPLSIMEAMITHRVHSAAIAAPSHSNYFPALSPFVIKLKLVLQYPTKISGWSEASGGNQQQPSEN